MADITDTEILGTLAQCGGSVTAASRELGIARSTIYSVIERNPGYDRDSTEREPPPLNSDSPEGWHECGSIATLCFTTKERIRTIEQALAYAEVDDSVWEVIEHSIVSHETPMKVDDQPAVVRAWNVRAKLRRRKPNDPLAIKNTVMEFLKDYAPKPRKRPSPKVNDDIMLEVTIPDIHMGKRGEAEVSGDDYNNTIARDLYLGAVSHILEEAKPYKPSRIVHVCANDAGNSDGPGYTTTKGTPQQSSAGWQRIFMDTAAMFIDGTEMMLATGARVDIVCHGSNHDEFASFAIGELLKAYYRNEDRVTVDNSPSPYKRVRHHDNLIMLTHGDKTKYPDLVGEMARLWPKDFAECAVKEVHSGHFHKNRIEDDYHSVVMRRMPSLCGTDAWHAVHGFVSRKSAHGYVWGKRNIRCVIHYTPDAGAYKR